MERGTILVVDDEPNIADLVELYLRRDGFRVVKAAAGEDVVAAVGTHRPRLVVLDVGLPDIDGLEVCRRLRQTSAIPVIFLTARDTEIDCVLDLGRREVRVDESPVAFTGKEFDLLKFLAERPGLALSRQQILDGVWGHDWFGDARTVDVHIAQVRKKVASAVRIDTVRGVGYRLDTR